MKQIIFGLVSQMAGGKETAKNYLEKKYQAESCRFSSSLRDILDRLFIEQSRENTQKLSATLRETFGQDILASTIAKEVKTFKSPIIVVDGVRRFSDIKYLQKLENFYLLAIETDEKIRYQRLIKRQENPGDEKKSFQDFLNDHKKEAEIEIPEVIKKSDYLINNNSDFKQLYQQIDKIIKDRQNN